MILSTTDLLQIVIFIGGTATLAIVINNFANNCFRILNRFNQRIENTEQRLNILEREKAQQMIFATQNFVPNFPFHQEELNPPTVTSNIL